MASDFKLHRGIETLYPGLSTLTLPRLPLGNSALWHSDQSHGTQYQLQSPFFFPPGFSPCCRAYGQDHCGMRTLPITSVHDCASLGIEPSPLCSLKHSIIYPLQIYLRKYPPDAYVLSHVVCTT